MERQRELALDVFQILDKISLVLDDALKSLP